MSWVEINYLKAKLKAIHPTLTDASIVDGEIEIRFSDSPHPMVATGFVWGSETRNLLEQLEDELLELEEG